MVSPNASRASGAAPDRLGRSHGSVRGSRLGLSVALSPTNLVYLLIGTMIGMVVGIIPGFGPSAGIAILMPITFGMDPIAAVVMLAAIYYGSMYGGTITSILLNTPGESATVAATFDGYPARPAGPRRAGAGDAGGRPRSSAARSASS